MVDFSTISSPVSAELPCGPNPDGIAELENFIAAAEGQLPASFLTFSKASFDAAGPLKEISTWLQQVRDLRLLVLAAKYLILSGDILGFANTLDAISSLLTERWRDVHPQQQDESYSLRGAHVGSLDDMPTVVLPLQYAPLIKDRKLGPLAYRSLLLATKVAQPRNGEIIIDESSIRDALLKFEDFEAIKTMGNAVTRSGAALKSIRSAFIDKAGYEDAPAFERLAPLIDSIGVFVGGFIQQREPSAALPENEPVDGQTAAGETGESASLATANMPGLQSSADAAEALKAVAGYFARHEPSSPALLLVRQAQQMVGKSFVDAMLLLAPAAAEKSTIKIGGESPFTLTFAQLKALAGQAAEPPAEGQTVGQTFTVASRMDSARLMLAVESYFRRVEPSSPIPLLIERARFFVDKDFPALLKDILKTPGS